MSSRVTLPLGVCLQVDRQHARKGDCQAGDAHGWASTCKQCKRRVCCNGVVLCDKGGVGLSNGEVVHVGVMVLLHGPSNG